MTIYIDESASEDGSILVVAALHLGFSEARRVVERFRRKHPDWTKPELKGAGMADALQHTVLREVVRQPGMAAALVVADRSVPHVGWARTAHGEHAIYAALAAEALAHLHRQGVAVHQVIADAGRYTGTVMAQLPAVIDAHCVALGVPALLAAGRASAAHAPRVQFDASQRHRGLQVVDVLANRALRTWREAQRVGAVPAGAAGGRMLPLMALPATLLVVPPSVPVCVPGPPVLVALP